MRRLTPALIATFIMATAVLAHTGVKDPKVKARMDGMKLLGAQTKILDQMAKGVMPFDPERALTAIEKKANRGQAHADAF
jgi:cytochrome c556